MPLIGDEASIDIPIWVPGSNTDLTPLAAAFITQANSALQQMERLLNRMRSQVLYVDKFTASANWKVLDQKLRIVGETWGYFQVTVQRTKTRLAVPNDGNFLPVVIGAISDTSMVPQSLAALSSTNTGRLAVGHALASGEVKLDSINSGADIQVNDIITLAGSWPLDDWLDSEV